MAKAVLWELPSCRKDPSWLKNLCTQLLTENRKNSSQAQGATGPESCASTSAKWHTLTHTDSHLLSSVSQDPHQHLKRTLPSSSRYCLLHNQMHHSFCFPIQLNITGIKPAGNEKQPTKSPTMSSIPHYKFSRFPISSPHILPAAPGSKPTIIMRTGPCDLAVTPFLLRRNKCITDNICSILCITV